MTSIDRIVHPNVSYWTTDHPLSSISEPLSDDTATDVLVVGAGYAGLATVTHLLARRADLDVTLVDAGAVGQGSSSRNAGMVEPITAAVLWLLPEALPEASADRAFHALLRRIDREMDELVHSATDVEARPEPVVLNSPSTVARQVLSSMRHRLDELDVDCEWVHADSARERWGVSGHGALVTPGYVVHPAKLVSALRDRAAGAGAHLHEHTPIEAVAALPSGGFCARTSSGHRIQARQIVDAASVWSRGLGLQRDPGSIRHTYMLATAPLPDGVLAGAGSEPAVTVNELDLAVGYRRIHRRRVLYGAFGDRSSHPERPLDDDAAGRLVAAAERRMPWLTDQPIDFAWGGPIKVNPTDLPTIGWLPDHPGALSVSGNSSCGIPWCLVGGAIAADLLDDHTDPDPDLTTIRRAVEHTTIPWAALVGLGLGWIWGSIVR